MLLILAPNTEIGRRAVERNAIYGEFKVVTPPTIMHVRGIRANTLMLASQSMSIEPYVAYYLWSCFSWLTPMEQAAVHEAIYAVTIGGEKAVSRYLDGLIKADKERKAACTKKKSNSSSARTGQARSK